MKTLLYSDLELPRAAVLRIVKNSVNLRILELSILYFILSCTIYTACFSRMEN